MADSTGEYQALSNLSKIRVCARVRPLFFDESQGPIKIDSVYNCIEVSDLHPSQNKNKEDANDSILSGFGKQVENDKKTQHFGPPKRFYLDDIFGEELTNRQVYNKFCKDIVSRVCDGYNGTIFAYGQTSSGKTHTMIGLPEDTENIGIDCLAVEQLINFANKCEDREISIWMSYLEIYNEVINDLLDRTSTNLKIREDNNSLIGSYVQGIKTFKLIDFEHFLELLK